MRNYIDIVSKLFEGEVIPFPGNSKPISNMAVARGGADVVGMPEHVDLDEFAKAYVVAALWSTTDDDGEPLDREHGIEDIASPTLKDMAADCAAFQQQNARLLTLAYKQPNYDVENAGHDFWLTRNRHGAGFWDRGLGAVGKRLTDACRAFGEVDLYIGDDKMIHG